MTDASVSLALIGLTVLVYSQVYDFDFVNFDDDVHVYENPFVTSGLTKDSIIWAFGIHGPSQWHPLAWLSHQADCELFDLWPGGHHLTSVALHAGSVVLLYFLLKMLCGATWSSAFVAAVFAVHPVNVESVAWISERRNVLCLFFGLLTMIAYVRYVRRGGLFRYLLVFSTLSLALMAKPLAVTLPCVLLLLDFWPLRRRSGTNDPSLRFLVIEKLPLFALSAASSVLTVWCQEHAVAPASELPLDVRLLNTLAAYGLYLQKVFWPAGLGVFYPHPGIVADDPKGELMAPAIAGALALVAITVGALKAARRWPCFAVGWFWFVGTLIPMIGLFQVGRQQMADRYLYLPMIGLLIAVSWTVRDLYFSAARLMILFAAVLIVGACAVTGWIQVGHWRNSTTLFEHTLAVTHNNPWAHNNLGLARSQEGDVQSAIRHFSEAVRLDPDYALSHYNLGVVLHDAGRADLAVHQFNEALRLTPTDVNAHLRLGAAHADLGHLQLAVSHFSDVVALSPDRPDGHLNLGIARLRQGEMRAARTSFQRVLRIEPSNARATYGLASAELELGNTSQARMQFERLIRIAPEFAPGYSGLGKVCLAEGETDHAVEQFEQALRLDPHLAEARTALQDLNSQ